MADTTDRERTVNPTLIALVRRFPGITTPELVEMTDTGSQKWRHHVTAELRKLHRHMIVRRRLIRGTERLHRGCLRPAVAWWLTEYGERFHTEDVK